MPPGRLPIVSPSSRLADLQKLAFHCGLNSSGTRAAIANHVNSQLSSWKPAPPDSRILSIDLGVRNLAYSLLTAGGGRRHHEAVANAVGAEASKPAQLHTWQRLALVPRRAGGPDGACEAAQDFSPAAMSDVAVRLVQERLLPLRPSHVLIERQRFRSGGGAAVLEWTVRVNSLEAMLYAVFAHLRATGAWAGAVIPIEPRKVAPFVLGERSGPGEKTAGRGLPRKKASDVKRLKIELLAHMLTAGEIDIVSDEARDMAAAFLQRQGARSSRKKSSPPSSPLLGSEKLDDLADSLLQGLAWLRWEQNRSTAKSQGDKAALMPFRN
ncbi:uncharacterized protein E0L32_003208 [Thyridium curvatum]|uniref:Mitochondrial resolvase Ydc2 catalytic domain-containing protein n=1 Tax=Thyridium curvatum TaxID=1093900 RepID=A0A507BK80_9PEZI|nr:uncharacterized protein E0L32_003208 [Thyridium curvatum]TPX17090.1 hypothetical protein E0L32_003208 [Thyridium curvatum]